MIRAVARAEAHGFAELRTQLFVDFVSGENLEVPEADPRFHREYAAGTLG